MALDTGLTAEVTAVGRLKREEFELEVKSGCIGRHCLQPNKLLCYGLAAAQVRFNTGSRPASPLVPNPSSSLYLQMDAVRREPSPFEHSLCAKRFPFSSGPVLTLRKVGCVLVSYSRKRRFGHLRNVCQIRLSSRTRLQSASRAHPPPHWLVCFQTPGNGTTDPCARGHFCVPAMWGNYRCFISRWHPSRL